MYGCTPAYPYFHIRAGAPQIRRMGGQVEMLLNANAIRLLFMRVDKQYCLLYFSILSFPTKTLHNWWVKMLTSAVVCCRRNFQLSQQFVTCVC
jgi:hypothetical protein